MTIAAKHMDPIFGIDFHLILAPPAALPVPMPTPYVGMVFDPFDYLPFIGATVLVNGLPRAQAGTAGVALTPHPPMGGPFGPPPPSHESEVFMGSTTVSVDGDAQSFLALPVLSCQTVGMPAPIRPKGQPPKSLVLPLSTVLSIPMGPPVIVGGPPTISLVALGVRGAMAGLGKLGKGLRRLQRGSGSVGKAMRAVTTKAQSAGDALAKALKLGDKGRNAIDRAICTVTGHPVDVATGKVFTDRVDFALPGALPFTWERVWYSTSTYRGPLGHGWHHRYDAALYVAPDVVLYRTPDGRLLSLPVLARGEEHFDRAERLTLIHEPSGYAIRMADRSLHQFRDIGRPNDEHVLSMISDASGNVVRLNYDDRGQLMEIVDTAGRTTQLMHDAVGRITAMTAPHPDGQDRRFTVLQYAYDDRGNLSQVTDALHQPFRYRYERHLLAQETDRNGLSFRFEYDGDDETARCVRTWGDDGIYDHRLSYDAERNITTVVNSLGCKTQYQHEGGLVVRTVDAIGATTLTEYDEHNHKITEVDALGHDSRFAYDDRGNLVEVKKADSATIVLQYNEHDQLVQVIDAIGGAWRWQYDAKGRLVERANPLGHATRFAYVGQQLRTLVDPAGHATKVDYDAQNNPIGLQAPDGTMRHWDYDVLGRVTTVTDANGNIQRRTHDLLGRPVRIEEPDGNTRTLAYDPEGNAVHVQDVQHDVHFSYQGMGRLAARSEAGTTVRFTYDTEEQLIAITNEHGHVYRFELGPTGEVLAEHGFDGVRRTYQRDRAGRVSAITRASGVLSKYRYDEANRVREVEHSDGARETYRYRLDGELIEARNQTCTVAFERDALGSVLREARDGHWVASEYDSRGLRTRMQSSFGADQRIERNVMGDVVGLSHGSKDAAKPFTAELTRDVLGLEIERSLPGGVRSRWRRDKLGRPVEHEITVGAGRLRARGYRWEANDRLRMIIDAQRGPVEYGHDALGSLAWARYSDGTQELRMPDAVGNLFRSEDRSDREYGTAGQLLKSVDKHGRATRYTYDSEGNLIEKRREDGECWHYRWGSDGLLQEVERPDGGLVRFAYDPLGRRIRKTFGARTTCWVWDGNVPLHEWVESDLEPLVEAEEPPEWQPSAEIKQRYAALGERSQRGPPEGGSERKPITWVFEPESFAPMAKLVGDARYSILADHLGTPSVMLDEQGAVAWSAEVGAWGQLRGLEGDRAACPFRWPGQYEDVETGLYYNRFRYYDPEAGEYASQDPIGLRGGAAPYGYVNDPLSSIDPKGLSGCQTGVAAKAAAWQTSSVDYPNADKWRDIILKKGTILYGGFPGPSPFYTTARGMSKGRASRATMFQGLQAMENKQFGYRPSMRRYEVTQDTPAAMALAKANPQHGEGGLSQLFVEDYESVLKPLDTIPLP